MAKKKKSAKKTASKKKTAKKATAKKVAPKTEAPKKRGGKPKESAPVVSAPKKEEKKIIVKAPIPSAETVVVPPSDSAQFVMRTPETTSSAIVERVASVATEPKPVLPPQMVMMIANLKRIIKNSRHALRKDEVKSITASIPVQAFAVKVQFEEEKEGYSISITDNNTGVKARMPEKETELYPLAK